MLGTWRLEIPGSSGCNDGSSSLRYKIAKFQMDKILNADADVVCDKSVQLIFIGFVWVDQLEVYFS